MTPRLTGICFATAFAIPTIAFGGVAFITSQSPATTETAAYVVPHHDGSDSARIDAEMR